MCFPGIDVAAGLAQVGGRRPLYLRVLKLFHDNQGRNFAREFAVAQAANDWEAQMRYSRTLKGVADTVGAFDLEESAADLLLAAERKDAARCADLLPNVIERLEYVVNGLSTLDDVIAPQL